MFFGVQCQEITQNTFCLQESKPLNNRSHAADYNFQALLLASSFGFMQYV